MTMDAFLKYPPPYHFICEDRIYSLLTELYWVGDPLFSASLARDYISVYFSLPDIFHMYMEIDFSVSCLCLKLFTEWTIS